MNEQRQPGTIRRIVMAATMMAAGIAGAVSKRFRGGYTQEVYAALSGLGGTVSIAGQKVNRATAFKLSAFLRGVTLISNYVGKTPTCIYKGRMADPTHPGHKLVRWWARKDWLTSMEFQRILTVHALVAGNGYGYIHRDAETMKPLELRVLDPSCVTPHTKNGRIQYRIHHRNKPDTFADAEAYDIIHIRGISWDELCGLEPLELSGDAVGIGLAQQGYAAEYLEKNGTPSVMVEYDQHLDDETWRTQKQRVSDAVRNSEAIVMDAGGKVKAWNLTADQMQLLQSREFTLVDIANLLNLAASKLNAKSNTSYKSLEEDNRAFRDDTLDPWFCQFELQFRKLLTERQQSHESHHVEFERRKLSRANLKEQGEFLSKAIGGPWMQPNEGREALNLPDVEHGDAFYPVQGAAPDAGMEPEPEPADEPTDEPVEEPTDDERSTDPQQLRDELAKRMAAEHAALSRDCGRICKRLSKQAQRAARKSSDFMDWLADLDTRAAAIADELQPVMQLCSRHNSKELAAAIITDLRANMQAIYDSEKPATFEATVTTAATRFEEAGSRFAMKGLSA